MPPQKLIYCKPASSLLARFYADADSQNARQLAALLANTLKFRPRRHVGLVKTCAQNLQYISVARAFNCSSVVLYAWHSEQVVRPSGVEQYNIS